MDISEIKKLIKTSTAVLVMENGEPSFVVLGYNAYKDMVADKIEEKPVKIHQSANGSVAGTNQNYLERETEILERLNKEILALKSQIEMEEKGLSRFGVDE